MISGRSVLGAMTCVLLLAGCNMPAFLQGGLTSRQPQVNVEATSTPFLPLPPTPQHTQDQSAGPNLTPSRQAFATATTTGAKESSGPSGEGKAFSHLPAEQLEAAVQILEGVNVLRISKGQPPLEVDDGLMSIAYVRAMDMSTRRYLGHFDPDTAEPMAWSMMTRAGYGGVLAENVCEASTGLEGLAEATVQAWSNSPQHAAVLLNADLKYTGLGLAGDDEQWVVVQVFAESRP